MGREAAERALLLGLSAVPQEHVDAYARGGWRGRIEPYTAYWTEGLARRAGEAGWEVRQIKRPASFEEASPRSGAPPTSSPPAASTSRRLRGQLRSWWTGRPRA